MVSITQCANGHFYDSSTYQACPYCRESQRPWQLRRSTVIFGRYLVCQFLGHGGFAVSYLASDLEQGTLVVLKECFPAIIADRAPDGLSVVVSESDQEDFAAYCQQLTSEAETLTRCTLPNIPRCFDCFKENNTCYLVTEYIPGPTLKNYIDMHGGRLAVQEAKRLLLPVLDDLDRLHEQGILHRDIAPDNLIISSGRDVAVLVDFGSALTPDKNGKTAQVFLKPGFSPPEQYMRYGKEGPWTDVYAFAAVFYYALTGKCPPDAIARIGEDTLIRPTQLNAALNADLESALLGMLSIHTRDRCSAAADFRRALAAVETNPASQVLYEDFSVMPHASLSSMEAEPFASTCAAAPLETDPFAETCPASSLGEELFAYTSPASLPEIESFANTGALSPMEAQPFASTCAASPMEADPFANTGAATPMGIGSAPSRPQQEPSRPGGLFSKFFQNRAKQKQPNTAQPPVMPPRVADVEFSALFPKHFLKGEYSVLEIYIYEQTQRHIIEQALASGGDAVKEKRGSAFRISEENVVRVRLESADPEVQILGSDEAQIWYGNYLVFDFSVYLSETYPKRQLMFTATVLINEVPATRLRFTAECNTLREQKLEVSREDILSAFISYASQDRARVAAIIQGMRKARPDMDVFFDVDSLRSGENWRRALRAEIERRDILFLCWSLAAKESEWVDREWRYALENKGLDCIEPIPIDPPNVCPPPKELASKHFNDRGLLYIDR